MLLPRSVDEDTQLQGDQCGPELCPCEREELIRPPASVRNVPFKWKIDLDELTSEALMTKIKITIASVKSDMVPEIDRLFEKELKADLRETRCQRRIIEYLQRCKEVIQGHGLLSIVADADGIKEKFKHLKRSLQPQRLQSKRFATKQTKTCDVARFNLVLAKAKKQDIRFQARRNAGRGKQAGGKAIRNESVRNERQTTTGPKVAMEKRVPKRVEGKNLGKGKEQERVRRPAHCTEGRITEGKDTPNGKLLTDNQAKRTIRSRSKRLKPDDDVHEPHVVAMESKLGLPYGADSGSRVEHHLSDAVAAEICSLVKAVKCYRSLWCPVQWLATSWSPDRRSTCTGQYTHSRRPSSVPR
ncbi:TPA: hypothetical protein N0F65_007846 [Lagenidium giganteum]|uniref:Uncharacterized protein n=1 Tax=Lagenidium giganteum TaxID=4803 RepID=A0AAV2YYX5_9STRA|nr:TPA: hypothetical protein N0F65_007846 [Lagenidium giganteum]